jgi:hypothetical protein
MGSSPTEPVTASPSPRAFALQELIACWDQGYEALAQGDLDRVAALLEVADDHLAGAMTGGTDSEVEARLRIEAMSAKGRLEHGMRSGLAGLQEELARSRQGAKVLRGYQVAHGATTRIVREA